MAYCTYILQCADGTLYTGMTNDLERRLRLHNAGRGAKYTRGRSPMSVVYREWCADKSEALRRERAIKRLSRDDKLELVSQNRESLPSGINASDFTDR